ncbi:extracellular solute-binding protein [Hahella sp. KA22]|uniref:ABC transporter substrate-binding protein n=2 Tax=Hahella sp. KA22 TaxID=1628392 RepID=UPI000FDD960D|nr:ABC transporter substrate-binding protein [Hahella sp. KA22]AZZ89708.1 carbohydrate ABC transporter substrate-binding protein [Hahella sp. KA22]QAY53078.1 extracellular solute-binding protein [Hahella sp. KA22]
MLGGKERRWLFAFLWLAFAMSMQINPAQAQELKVALMVFSGDQRAAFNELSRQFEKENPDINVRWLAYDEDAYKGGIERWLSKNEPADVLYWQAGERLLQYVRQGFVEPIDDLWRAQNFDADYTDAIKDTVSWRGRVYAVPYSYYQWGLYYRQSLFRRLGLQPPQDWDGLLKMCGDMRKAGVAPFTIGTHYHWTAAAWFDYLNLRINGLAFHRELTSGLASYMDPRVRDVFEHWKTLLDKDCFIDHKLHREWDWKQSLPLLYRGHAGMLLMGNFFSSTLPEDLAADFRFAPFPMINPDLPRYEEAPTDVFLLPVNSVNKEPAKKFLAFIGRADVQAALNNKVGKISTNLRAAHGDDYFIRVGAELLQSAAGISQFFDRDSPKAMADEAVRIFTEFMVVRDIERTQAALERARRKHY